ncbi:hypothetical protein U1Q18_021618 [Sarracenia purpurea var. burkii]
MKSVFLVDLSPLALVRSPLTAVKSIQVTPHTDISACLWELKLKLGFSVKTKTCRYLHGVKPEADKQGFLPEGSGSMRVLGIDRNVDNTWNLTPSCIQVDPSLNPCYSARLQSNSCQPHVLQDFELMSNAAMSRQRQQHCFFGGSDVGSHGSVKHEGQGHSMRPFLDDWPKDRTSWSDLDDQGYDKNTFSTTQLSISVPIPLSEISSRSTCSPNDD